MHVCSPHHSPVPISPEGKLSSERFLALPLVIHFIKKKKNGVKVVYLFLFFKCYECFPCMHVCALCLYLVPEKARGCWNCSHRQLLVIMWVLGTEPGSSERAASSLDCWAISPVPEVAF